MIRPEQNMIHHQILVQTEMELGWVGDKFRYTHTHIHTHTPGALGPSPVILFSVSTCLFLHREYDESLGPTCTCKQCHFNENQSSLPYLSYCLMRVHGVMKDVCAVTEVELGG